TVSTDCVAHSKCSSAGRWPRITAAPAQLSSAVPWKHPTRATIAFLESDRPDAPRAGDAYGDVLTVSEQRLGRVRGNRFCPVGRPLSSRLVCDACKRPGIPPLAPRPACYFGSVPSRSTIRSAYQFGQSIPGL